MGSKENTKRFHTDTTVLFCKDYDGFYKYK